MEAGDLQAISDQARPPFLVALAPEPPTNLVCPITKCLYEDPVMVVETGHTYERRAIEEHFLVNGSTNPLTSKQQTSGAWPRQVYDIPQASGTASTAWHETFAQTCRWHTALPYQLPLFISTGRLPGLQPLVLHMLDTLVMVATNHRGCCGCSRCSRCTSGRATTQFSGCKLLGYLGNV